MAQLWVLEMASDRELDLVHPEDGNALGSGLLVISAIELCQFTAIVIVFEGYDVDYNLGVF
ncbi:hypothetical protein ACLOJK_037428 [Asimina triloba]